LGIGARLTNAKYNVQNQQYGDDDTRDVKRQQRSPKLSRRFWERIFDVMNFCFKPLRGFFESVADFKN
jgi:hypothetical protein